MSNEGFIRQNDNISGSSRGYIRQTDNISRNSREYIRQTDSLRSTTTEAREKPKEYISRNYKRAASNKNTRVEKSKDIREAQEKIDNSKNTHEEVFKTHENNEKPSKLKGSTVMQEPRVVSHLDSWRDWNTTPRTEDEIREMCLTNFNFVCFTYICGYSQMSADFIEELMVLSTGLLNKDNYDEYYEPVKEALLIQMGIEEGEVDLSKLPIKCINGRKYEPSVILSERLDWGYIKSIQKDLPTWFKLKYHKQLSNKTYEVAKLHKS